MVAQIVIATIINKSMTMKKIIIILISFAAMLISCSKSEVWLDNDIPLIYIPQEGFSINTAWLLESNEYTINFGVYLSGVRPDNQNNNIEVTFNLKPSLIVAYNNDITQLYSGRVQELPADCYQITENKTTITKGKVSAVIPIKVYTDKLNALPKLNAGLKTILYTIPLSLESTSAYKLTTDTTMLNALCGIQLDYPRFYFWVNRALTTTMGLVGRKVIFGQTPVEELFKISSYGLTADEDYTLNFDINTAAVPTVPAGGLLLPANAYELPSTTLTIPKGAREGYFPVKIINDNVGFRQVYYLPVRISSASKYKADSVKGTLLLKVEVKNDYEWSYTSQISCSLDSNQRSGTTQVTKAPTSYDASTIQLQMSSNYSSSSFPIIGKASFNDMYYRLKITPNPGDDRKWGVELIKVTGMVAPMRNSPLTLELDPTKESYYDWAYETFFLNYRWKNMSGTAWIKVSEVLQASFF